MIVNINLTEDAKKEARENQDKINEKGRLLGTNNMNNERDYVGYLGEWAFNEFLKMNDFKSIIKWSREITAYGGDVGDFFFDEKVIDVKTASKPFYKKLMMPLKQFEKKEKYYYVGVRLDGDLAEIMGFATYEDMKNAPIDDFGHNTPTKNISFSKLKPIDELLSQQILKKWEIKQ